MNGQQLKQFLKERDITGRDLAKKMDRTEETIYAWFKKPKIKKVLLERIAKALAIPYNELGEKAPTESDTGTIHGVVHHGEIAYSYLQQKGISVLKFAENMNESRVTSYKWFEEKEWDEGRLFKAAAALAVPIAQLKGKRVQSFEKEIYTALQNIEKQLIANREILQKLHAKYN